MRYIKALFLISTIAIMANTSDKFSNYVEIG